MYAFLLYPLAFAELVPRGLLLACRAVLRLQEPPAPNQPL